MLINSYTFHPPPTPQGLPTALLTGGITALSQMCVKRLTKHELIMVRSCDELVITRQYPPYFWRYIFTGP